MNFIQMKLTEKSGNAERVCSGGFSVSKLGFSFFNRIRQDPMDLMGIVDVGQLVDDRAYFDLAWKKSPSAERVVPVPPPASHGSGFARVDAKGSGRESALEESDRDRHLFDVGKIDILESGAGGSGFKDDFVFCDGEFRFRVPVMAYEGKEGRDPRDAIGGRFPREDGVAQGIRAVLEIEIEADAQRDQNHEADAEVGDAGIGPASPKNRVFGVDRGFDGIVHCLGIRE